MAWGSGDGTWIVAGEDGRQWLGRLAVELARDDSPALVAHDFRDCLVRVLAAGCPSFAWNAFLFNARGDLLFPGAGGSRHCFGSKFTEFVRDDTAVLVVDQVTLRDGDGEAFGTVTELASAAGRPVKCIASRGRWIQIQLDNGTVGWVPADTAVTI